jgi:hypothetical protein
MAKNRVMPTKLSEFQVDLVEMLQRFFAGHVDNFDTADYMRRVQAAMVLVAENESHFMLWPKLTLAVSAVVSVTGNPSIAQLIILRDSRRRARAVLEAAVM